MKSDPTIIFLGLFFLFNRFEFFFGLLILNTVRNHHMSGIKLKKE